MIKTPWLVLPLLILFVLLPRLSIDLYLPSLPLVGHQLFANEKNLQMTMTSFMFGYAVSMLLAGQLADLWSRKKTLLAGLIIFCIASFVCASTDSIYVLIIARFFQALGGCCGTVIARIMVKDAYQPEKQLSILTSLSAAMAISPIISPIIGGGIGELLGWQSIFYILTSIGLMLYFLSRAQLELDLPRQTTFSFKVLLRDYKHLLTHRLFIGYSLAIGLAWSAYFAFTVDSPFILQNQLHLSSVKFGIIFAASIVGYVIGTRLANFLAKQWKLSWDTLIFIATLLCLMGSLAVLILVSKCSLSWEIITFPMIILMLGVGIIIPCTQAAVMQPFSAIPGVASGLFFFIQMLFGTVTGFVAQNIPVTPIAMSSIIVIASILLFISYNGIIYFNSKRM